MDLGVDSKRGLYVKHVVYDTLSMAAPTWLNCMAASAVQLFCISLISEHGSVAELAALGLSNVFCNISGNSMIWGLAAALDTLSPQALGAGEKRLAGMYCLRAITLMFLTGSVPILSVWLFAGPLLSALGQDPEVVTAAAAFIRWRIPGVLCLPVYVGVSKTMIAMGKTTLPGGVSLVSNLCSAVIAWLLLAKLGWGVEGAAVALSAAEVLQSLLIGVLWREMGEPTFRLINLWHSGMSRDALRGWRPYLALALPALVMQNVEWWSWEICIFMSGLISPEVLAAQTILASVLSVLYFTPLAISYSSSAIIGTRLGGNDVFGAQRAATIIVSTSCLISSGWIVAVLLLRNQIADLLAGGEDGGVTTLVVKLMPLAALFHAFDAFQAAMTGVVKGTGQQRSFALVILLCYWVVGLPTAALLTFRFDYGVNGLWYGMIVAAALQSISYLLMLMFRVSFTAAAEEAASRIDGQSAYLPLQGALEKDLPDDDDIASY